MWPCGRARARKAWPRGKREGALERGGFRDGAATQVIGGGRGEPPGDTGELRDPQRQGGDAPVEPRSRAHVRCTQLLACDRQARRQTTFRAGVGRVGGGSAPLRRWKKY